MGTRVLMEQFALERMGEKFVGESNFNYPMDLIRRDEQTLRHTSPFTFKKYSKIHTKQSLETVALNLTSLF